MNTLNRPLNRLLITAVVLSVLLVLAALALSPGNTLARAEGPEQTTPPPQQAGPPLPSPPPLQVNPPAATAEPDAVTVGSGVRENSSAVEAVRFRPRVQLTRGQSLVPTGDGDKPAGHASTSVEKPPAEQQIGPQEAYTPPDYKSLLRSMDWGVELYEDFEGVFPGAWILEDFSDDGYDLQWGIDDYKPQGDLYSAWPAAGGADGLDPDLYYYPNNLNSWMEYGPFDFSNMADIFVSFGLWYETEPGYDWVYFCASTDFVHYSCDYWSGNSGGWTDQAYWLTSYAGYSQVWLAWTFQSDGSFVDDGPFVDEVWVWGNEIGTPPTPTPTPDPSGQLIQNGSFETGDLTDWAALGDQVRVTGSTYVDGNYSAVLGEYGSGDHFLYQAFSVPADATDLVLNYWFAVTTTETEVDHDLFCAGIRPSDLSEIWVDLGCVDAVDATGTWQQFSYTLDATELTAVAGQSVALVFELYNDFYGQPGQGGTAGWVDYAHAYATGGSAGAPLDPNEPNDDPASATSIACGGTVAGVVGDALGGYDVDWFRVDNVPVGQMDIDIRADTQVPPSALDSIVGLWDDSTPSPNLLAWNDDDGTSLDSYVVYTNTLSDATFYISVESYLVYGSADSFYDLTVQCSGSGSGAPPVGSDPTPPDADTWTVMLYLNAEDPGFETILTQYRTNIEAFIGSKDHFLTVAILYDGSGTGNTVRYQVQPNGNYTLGTNQWNLGELNMGHPDTLANFVTWAMDQFPAENYYLAVDDHGDGVYGISFDSTSNNDQLTPPELYSALKSATQNGVRKIHIFDYEACLMGLAENAYDLRRWVDYVVFSEQISWGINTYPRYFSDLAATDTPLTIGQRIVDRYHEEAMRVNSGRGYPHTISLIDTSQMTAVSNAVSDLGNAIKATDTQAQKDAINNARDDSQAFAADWDATNYRRAEYIDLWDLADEASSLAPTQATAAKSAVQAAVVRERHVSGVVAGYTWDHSGAHGLAIYYPPTTASSAFDNYVAASLYRMSQDGTWDEFLAWAVPSSGNNRRGMFASRSQLKLADDSDAFAFKYIYLPAVIK